MLARSTPEGPVKIVLLIAIMTLLAGVASGQESGRIKRKPPTPAEADREAANAAMNDSLLRKGDIVATDRGFVIFLGPSEDGTTNQFAPVNSPGARPTK
jgi:hypothetical protein